MLSIIVAILVFGLIILVHEFGHFLLAKLNGIGVVEFSIGMGPRLWSIKKGETRYSIKLLPFGGSCMMLGEETEDADPKAFTNHSVWARISVIAAGPLFNFILAFVFSMVIVCWAGYDEPKLPAVVEDGALEVAGIQEGDVITRIGGEKVTVYRDIVMYIRTYPYFNAGDPVEIEYMRDGVTYNTVAQPTYSEEKGSYLLGVYTGGYWQPVTSVGEALKYGSYEIVYQVKSIFKSLSIMIRGQAKSEDIAGPVRIVSMIDSTVEQSKAYGISTVIINILYMSILLSANLGIVNLFPIPALDGGRLVFLIIEAIRGKPINREKEGMVHLAGLMLLMVLMVVVLFHDMSFLMS